MKMVCGQTTPGATNWVNYSGDTHVVMVSINTAAAGFTTTPYYFTSLGGNGRHYKTTGATSIYNATSNSFLVHVVTTENLNLHTADINGDPTYRWFINWCAVGN